MEDTLQKGAEFKKNLERIGSQLQTHTEIIKPQSKKQKTQLSSEHVQSQQEPREEQTVPLLQIAQREHVLKIPIPPAKPFASIPIPSLLFQIFFPTV